MKSTLPSTFFENSFFHLFIDYSTLHELRIKNLILRFFHRTHHVELNDNVDRHLFV